jgi:hypothetical protein
MSLVWIPSLFLDRRRSRAVDMPHVGSWKNAAKMDDDSQTHHRDIVSSTLEA